jgi:hypothetical protein
MIILDTNQLDRHSLDSSFMALLKMLSNSTGHALAISEVTYNEHCAHYEYRLRRACSQAARSRSELDELLKVSHVEEEEGIASFVRGPSDEDVEAASSAYKSRLLSIFRLIELSGPSAIEALRREAWRVAPASTSFDTKGSGARDAAIWLSLIGASAGSTETVYFISSDRRAFRTDRCVADSREDGAAIVILSDIGELLSLLADDVDAEVNIALIKESSVVKERFTQYINATNLLWAVNDVAIEGPSGTSSWAYGDPVNLEFMSIHDVHGHVIKGSKWITGRVRWSVRYPVRIDQFKPEEIGVVASKQVWDISFQIVASLLFKGMVGVESVEILSIGKPSQITGQLETLQQLD